MQRRQDRPDWRAPRQREQHPPSHMGLPTPDISRYRSLLVGQCLLVFTQRKPDSPHTHDVSASLLVPPVVPPFDSHPDEGLGVRLLIPVAVRPAAGCGCEEIDMIGRNSTETINPMARKPLGGDRGWF